jgi:hypothetical protein
VIHGERLFDEYWLSSFEAKQRRVAVSRMWDCDVDDVDVGIFDECLVAAVASRELVLTLEYLGAFDAPGSDRDDLTGR